MSKVFNITIVILAFNIYGVNAQNVLYVGPSLSFAHAFAKVDYSTSTNNNLKTRFNLFAPIGIDLQYSVKDKFSIVSGISIQSRPNRFGRADGDFYTTTYINNDVISIPLLLKFKKNIFHSDKHYAAFQSGITFDIYDNYGGCGSGSSGGGSETNYTNYDQQVFGVSVKLGVGFEKKLNNNALFNISLFYSKGLNKILTGHTWYWDQYLDVWDTIRFSCEPITTIPATEEYNFFSRGSYTELKLSYKWRIIPKDKSRKKIRIPEDDNIDYSELLYMKNHHSLNVNTTFDFFEVTNRWGKGKLIKVPVPGFAFTYLTTLNITNRAAIETGITLGTRNTGFRAVFSKDEFNIPWSTSMTFSFIGPFAEFPVMLKLRARLGKKNIVDVKAGVGLHYQIPFYHGSGFGIWNNDNDTTYDLFDMYYDFIERTPYLSYKLGVGYNFRLKNYNLIRFGIQYNLSFRKNTDGAYSFLDNGVVVGGGKLSSKGSYLSIGLGYVFTRAKKMYRKANNL